MLYSFGAGESAISISSDPAASDGKLVHTIRRVGTVTSALSRVKTGDQIGLRGVDLSEHLVPVSEIAEMTEIPYKDIMLMAIFPAVIYFLSVFVMVHFEAKRYGLKGQREADAPTAWQILQQQWFMSFPLVIIVVLMLWGFSPG